MMDGRVLVWQARMLCLLQGIEHKVCRHGHAGTGLPADDAQAKASVTKATYSQLLPG